MRPPLPRAQFDPPQQTQHQMAPSRVRVNSEMDLPIEEIGTVPIDQIDRESHVILPDGKQIVLLQVRPLHSGKQKRSGGSRRSRSFGVQTRGGEQVAGKGVPALTGAPVHLAVRRISTKDLLRYIQKRKKKGETQS